MSDAESLKRQITVSGGRERLRYGTAEFAAATSWSRLLPDRLRPGTLAVAVVRHPRLLNPRVLASLAGLPAVRIRINAAELHAWPHIRLGPFRRIWPAAAVLELSARPEEYLAGRRMQALRTNLRRAADAGIATRRIGYEAWREVVGSVHPSRPARLEGNWSEPPEPRSAAYYAAYDAAARPVAFASAALFGQAAFLFSLVSDPAARPHASLARYALHMHVAQDLAAQGAQLLLVGSALRQPEGLQYFQHLLGYRAVNLRIIPVTGGAGSRRTSSTRTPSVRTRRAVAVTAVAVSLASATQLGGCTDTSLDLVPAPAPASPSGIIDGQAWHKAT